MKGKGWVVGKSTATPLSTVPKEGLCRTIPYLGHINHFPGSRRYFQYVTRAKGDVMNCISCILIDGGRSSQKQIGIINRRRYNDEINPLAQDPLGSF